LDYARQLDHTRLLREKKPLPIPEQFGQNNSVTSVTEISSLPHVPVRLVSGIPAGSVAPVGLLQCLRQPIGFPGNRDQVDTVRHHAISDERNAVEVFADRPRFELAQAVFPITLSSKPSKRASGNRAL
jgi:hypothetical protein